MSDKDLDLLSAIWVMSANDDNSIITYKGICVRLNIQNEGLIRGLVLGRRDLFRLGVRKSVLNTWKSEMKSGRHLSGWLSDINEKQDRDSEIEKLTPDDVFRNQFRVADGAPKCDLKTIDWGVQYIERLRKAGADRRQERRVFYSFVLSGISAVVAIGTLAGSVWFQTRSIDLQVRSIDAQTDLKKYEVTFKPRQEGYLDFMTTAEDAFIGSQLRDIKRVADAVTKFTTKLYALEPFLTEAQRFQLGEVFNQYIALCNTEMRLPPLDDVAKDSDSYKQAMNKFASYKAYFRLQLHSALFAK